MSKSLKIRLIAIAAILLIPALVSAQTIGVPNPGLPSIGANANLGDAVMVIIQRWLLPIAGIIAVLFVIIGGFQYMLAGANEDLAKKGRATLRNAIIGLIIVILSYVMITVVVNTLTRFNSGV
jgi:hypothetical protein